VEPVEEEIEAPDDVDTALKEVERSLKALDGIPPEPSEEVGEQKIGYAEGAAAKETYYEDEAGEEGLSAEEFECPECGYPVSITAYKCPNCGVEFEDEV
jgi:DNA-directed RNA polymerase subunit RPC12/RpoP